MEFISYKCVKNRNSGDHSVGVPPLPIPNREVKPTRADGTALSCGRVGHRHFYTPVRVISKKLKTLTFYREKEVFCKKRPLFCWSL